MNQLKIVLTVAGLLIWLPIGFAASNTVGSDNRGNVGMTTTDPATTTQQSSQALPQMAPSSVGPTPQYSPETAQEEPKMTDPVLNSDLDLLIERDDRSGRKPGSDDGIIHQPTPSPEPRN